MYYFIIKKSDLDNYIFDLLPILTGDGGEEDAGGARGDAYRAVSHTFFEHLKKTCTYLLKHDIFDLI